VAPLQVTLSRWFLLAAAASGLSGAPASLAAKTLKCRSSMVGSAYAHMTSVVAAAIKVVFLIMSDLKT
jgi:hypothetical protein